MTRICFRQSKHKW